jgi:adenine specific DNA methylase Mod
MNKLYFGDNLDVLREHIQDESVDLIYLDPPFNSQANYNVLFKTDGKSSEAQAEAFRDTWEWGEIAEAAYDDVIRASGDIALVLSGFRKWLGENAMMAYLAMMTARLIELHRVLKPTGSVYLHCDPVASHYLKVMLDAIFGPTNFRSEIIWKRTSSHNNAKRWGPIHDTILFASKSDDFCWNRVMTEYDKKYVEKFYKHKDADGRLFRLSDLTGSGVRHGESGKPWNGFNPTRHGRHWGVPSVVKEEFPDQKENLSPHEWLDLFNSEGLIEMTGEGVGWPHVRRYFDRMEGQLIQDIVLDIPPLSKRHTERLGYPTQKPLALLERIIKASSNKDMVILDPFCGCGTTVEAAQHLQRNWIGIDVTHYAITLIEARLLRAKTKKDSYQIQGRPTDLAGAQELARRDKHQFQWWAAWRLGAQTYREEKRGADRGIDGNIFFANGPYGTGRIIISVKGGEHLGVAMVRDLRGVIERENAEMGVLITLSEPTAPMVAECAAAGFVSKSAHGDRLPRLQIVKIADILEGKMPKLPPIPQPRDITRRGRKHAKDQLEMLLPLAGKIIAAGKGEFIDPRFDARLLEAAK